MYGSLLVLIKPLETLRELASKPKWFAAYMMLSVVSIVSYVVIHPFLVQAVLAHLPSTATLQEREVVVQTLKGELPLRCMFLPVRLLIGWAVFGFGLYIICDAFKPPEPVRFAKVFSLEVHAETVNVIANLSALVLPLTGHSNVGTQAIIPLSAAMVVSVDDSVTLFLLNSASVFTVWYIVLLSAGISLQTGFKYTRSLVTVLATWCAYALFTVIVLKLMQNSLHLLV
jgi:hypothetical protein